MNDERKRDWRPLPADAIASLSFLLGAPLIAVLTGMLLPLLSAARVRGDKVLFVFAISIAAIGIAGLALVKCPLWRQGRFTSFGPSGLTGRRRHLYWIAYALIVLGAFLLAALTMSVRLQ